VDLGGNLKEVKDKEDRIQEPVHPSSEIATEVMNKKQ